MARSVWRRSLGVVSDPASVFHALVGPSNPAVWLGSYGERGSGTSVVATGEVLELPANAGLDTIRDWWHDVIVDEHSEPGVPLGLVGWLPFDLTRETLGIAVSHDDAQSPTRFLRVNRSVSIDHASGALTAWALLDVACEQERDDCLRWAESVAHRIGSVRSAETAHRGHRVTAQWRDTPEEYRHIIESARQAIREGEVYQLCTTTSVEMDRTLEDWELHQLLIDTNPTQHQGLLRLGDISLVSASPETFLTVDSSGTVTTRPIKGTRPRDDSPERDQELASELVSSEKERAENLMIVDLMRNDLQRVCEVGSVQVTGLFEVESYASVHQLVSTVSGLLAPGRDAIDALEACFPAGSMTGAPKHRAVSLLTGLESGPRGIYSGAWGWFRPDGSMELAMTIRSAVLTDKTIRIGVGGGITWSSEADQEIAEVGHKARRLLDALAADSIHYS